MSVLAHRDAIPSDLEFIRYTWAASYKFSHFAGPTPMGKYRERMHEDIQEWLCRQGVVALVAHKPGELPPDDAYGWVVAERDVVAPMDVWDNGRREARWKALPQPLLHYVYVKQPYRRLGVARGLLSAVGDDCDRVIYHTFSTAVVPKIQAERRRQRLHPLALRFEPLIVRFPKNKHEVDEP